MFYQGHFPNNSYQIDFLFLELLSLLALFLVLELAVDVSFDEFQPTLVQLLQQGQHCAQDIFVPVVVVRSCLIRICKPVGAAAAWLASMVRGIVSRVEGHEATPICCEVVVVPCCCVHATVPVRNLLAASSCDLVLTIIVPHIIS